MATLDDAAFGAATKVTPKFVSPSDPSAQWTGAMRAPAVHAYSDNYLIDVNLGIILDAEASRSIRQAEVGASKTMIERTQQRFDIKPERLAGDTAYGSGANLNWLVKDKDIAPHIPVIDKSKREDGTFSREDFTFDKDRNVYICPANKILTTTGKLVNDGETLMSRQSARLRDCLSRPSVIPRRPSAKFRAASTRKLGRCPALAKTEAFKQSSRDRKRVELFAPWSVSCGSAGCDCAGHAVPSSSSRWQRLRRTSAGLPSWSPGHHRSPLCALRKRCKRQ